MPCYHPQRGYRSRIVNPSGKRSIVFNPRDGYPDLAVTLPCGQCIGCRLERSRQWAIRCMHEAQLHEANCFLTLTFDDENLDPKYSLRKSDFQLFMKRFRKLVDPVKLRYFHCGEYGENFGRPHHHAIIFGYDFPDKVIHSENLYTSPTLSGLWPYGYSTIGDCTFDSCAYVARYIMKKQTGDKAADHYGDRVPEYNTMSRRPGIGTEWYNQFKTDVYPSDECVIREKITCKPPKFYDGLHEALDPNQMSGVKRKRLHLASRHREDQTPERLAVRESIITKKLAELERKL